MEAQLGDLVKDRITGFSGIVTSAAKCLTGCDRATVRGPCTSDGKLGEEYWFDIPALEVIEAGKVLPSSVRKKNSTSEVGGPPSAAKRI